MSYQEKRTVVSIFTGLVILVAYCIYALNRFNTGILTTSELKPWATTILIFIGIGIVASIVIQIVFHILLSISVAVVKKIQNESTDDAEIEKSINLEMMEDEMDKLINLKSSQVGFFFAGIGFVAALISLVLNYPPVVMINILFISFSVGSLIEGFVQLYFYRKGIYHG
jgi:hypothetical protein